MKVLIQNIYKVTLMFISELRLENMRKCSLFGNKHGTIKKTFKSYHFCNKLLGIKIAWLLPCLDKYELVTSLKLLLVYCYHDLLSKA